VTKSIQSLSKNHTPPCSDREHQAHPPTASSTVGNNAENINRQKAESDRPGSHCQVPPNPATATISLLSFAVSPRRGVTGRRLS